MKRRDFLKYGSASVATLSSSAVITGCSEENTDDESAFWRQGNFPPVTEEVTVSDLTVEGSIPKDLNGYYYRNGPNSWKGPSRHFFFGDGMIHGIKLEDSLRNSIEEIDGVFTYLVATKDQLGMAKLQNVAAAPEQTVIISFFSESRVHVQIRHHE